MRIVATLEEPWYADQAPPTSNPARRNSNQTGRYVRADGESFCATLARIDMPYSAPLVEGTPLTRGSDSVASRSARATALYSASVMWWGSRP